MSGVRVVADSSVCLPRALIKKYNIELVPETIIFGTKIYRDGVDLDATDFYVLLGRAKDLPTTSAPSPQDFVNAYKRAGKDADAIACILVTAGFSKMGLQAAFTAQESVTTPPIEIVDSRTAVGAYGFVVLAAARVAAEGKSLAEVIKAAESVQRRVNLVLTLDTLKYLAKGGRIGKAAQWAGTMLSIKPILEVPVATGAIEPIERVRSRPKALRRLLGIMQERVGEGEKVHVSIDHANVPEEAEQLRSEITSLFDCTEIFINNWAPVAGVHCGPGVIGLSFYAGD
ncbi:MAG: DegV family protein [Dehalococcoidia bacterium]|jgi:DegV family protein with EDD domain